MLSWSVIIFERSRSVEEALSWQGTGSIGCTSNATLALHGLATNAWVEMYVGEWKEEEDKNITLEQRCEDIELCLVRETSFDLLALLLWTRGQLPWENRISLGWLPHTSAGGGKPIVCMLLPCTKFSQHWVVPFTVNTWPIAPNLSKAQLAGLWLQAAHPSYSDECHIPLSQWGTTRDNIVILWPEKENWDMAMEQQEVVLGNFRVSCCCI